MPFDDRVQSVPTGGKAVHCGNPPGAVFGADANGKPAFVSSEFVEGMPVGFGFAEFKHLDGSITASSAWSGVGYKSNGALCIVRSEGWLKQQVQALLRRKYRHIELRCVAWTRRGEYTVCEAVTTEKAMLWGVTKRNPRDVEDEILARLIAFGRAMKDRPRHQYTAVFDKRDLTSESA